MDAVTSAKPDPVVTTVLSVVTTVSSGGMTAAGIGMWSVAMSVVSSGTATGVGSSVATTVMPVPAGMSASSAGMTALKDVTIAVSVGMTAAGVETWSVVSSGDGVGSGRTGRGVSAPSRTSRGTIITTAVGMTAVTRVTRWSRTR